MKRGMTLVATAVAVLSACGSSSTLVLPPFVPPSTTTTTHAAVTTRLRATTPSTTSVNSPTSAGSATSAPGSTVAALASWTPVVANLAGVPSECGNVSPVWSRPDRDMLIVGVAQHGLSSSVDNAESWTGLGQGAGSAAVANRASSIVFDPDHPGTFWEAGIYGDGGVYRTDDNGVTFRQLGDVRHVDAVAVDFTDPSRNVLLATIHEQPTVMRSGDGGATWQDLSSRFPAGIGETLAPIVLSSQNYLVGSWRAPESGIFRTTDAGATWQRVYAPTGRDLAGLPLVAKTDQAIYWMLQSGGLIKSADGGATWTQVAADGTLLPTLKGPIELPDGRLAAVGDRVVVSADKGVKWRPIGSPLPIKPVGFAYSPYRDAFYISYFTCATDANPVPPDSIQRLAFDYQTE